MPAAPPESRWPAADDPPGEDGRYRSWEYEDEPSGRHGGYPPVSTGRRVAFIAAEIGAVIALVVLAFTGFNRVLDSREGRVDSANLGPGEPNFEANVTPTPTALFMALGPDQRLSSVVVLALTNSRQGSVLFVPPDTLAPTAFSSTGTSTLIKLYEAGQEPAVAQGVADILGTSFTDVLPVVSHDRLVQVLTPVQPLSIQNPDALDVRDAQGVKTRKFKAGPLALSAEDAAAYLETSNTGESDVARMVRQQALWEAWLSAVATSTDPDVVPGETATGLGHYVRAVAPLEHHLSTLAVKPGPGLNFLPDATAVVSELAALVPYPTSSRPGARIRVRLLDAAVDPTTSGPVLARVAGLLVPANAEIVIVGNADSFDRETTQIVVHDPQFQDAAQTFRTALGAGDVVEAEVPTDAQDVTVIMGRDLADGLS
jgi:hypothetical protein